MNDLYLNTSTLMTTPSAQALRAALEAGFRGIEIRMERLMAQPGEVAEVRTMQQAVLSVNGLQIQIGVTGQVDQERLERELDERLSCCRELSAPLLLIVPPRTGVLGLETALPGLRAALRFCQAQAAESGISVAFEFLGFPDCPVNTVSAAMTVTSALDIRLVIDSCHWYASGAPALSRAVVESVVLVHLNDVPEMAVHLIEDADRILPGEGVLPVRSFVAQLRALGYRGPWSVKTFNPEYWQDDPFTVARRAYRAGRWALEG